MKLSFFSSFLLGFSTAVLGVLVVISFSFWRKSTSHSLPFTSVATHSTPFIYSTLADNGTYASKDFNITKSGIALTAKQINEHLLLYKKYVDKRNEIAQLLKNVNKNDVSKTYSTLRALKEAETYAVNGQILHELYFENIGQTRTPIGTLTTQLVTKSFGSIDNFKDDFLACALVARGWVMCAYSIDDGLLHNFVLEEHNSHVPVLSLPILVLDVYEHAYFMDYGTHAKQYSEQFWDHIAWNIIENRIQAWALPFKNNHL